MVPSNPLDDEPDKGTQNPPDHPSASGDNTSIGSKTNRPEMSNNETIEFSAKVDPSMEETGDQAETIDQLVVYLDGQLEGEERRNVEASILSDPSLQVHLAGLQESWDALDVLQRPDAGEKFTESTVKFVVDTELTRRQPRQWPKFLKFGLLGGVAVTVALCGFAATDYLRSSDQRRFYNDYELIENLDLYQGTGDFDFLVQMQEEDVFQLREDQDAK